MTTSNASRSIFWPLLFVAAGVIWLSVDLNLLPAGNVWILARFWPVLLIGLGLDLIFRQRWPLIGNLIALTVIGLAVLAVWNAPRLGLSPPGWTFNGLLPLGGERGSGRVATDTRPVSGFDTVAFNAYGELTITAGESESLTIEAEDNVLDHIQTEVRGGTLHIDVDNAFAVSTTQPVRFNLVVKDLTGLDLAGAGSVVATGLKGPRLDVRLGGVGSLKLQQLAVDALNCTLSGAGSLEASGQVERLAADLSGFGSLQAQDLQAATADVTISGTGSATVWVTERLQAAISGLGSIHYYGQPTVSENVSGLGRIQQAGGK